MKALQQLSEKELLQKLRELQDALRSQRFQVANMHLKTVRTLRQTRKDIARIQMVLSQKQAVTEPSSTTS